MDWEALARLRGTLVLLMAVQRIEEALESFCEGGLRDDAAILALPINHLMPVGVLVEELDHFLVLAARTRRGVPVSLLELELHANVTKDLVVRRMTFGTRG